MKYIIFFFVALFAIGNLFSQVALDSGLVAKYLFSGNANDGSPFNNNGVVYGAVLTSDRSGNLNSAYSFDGTTSFIKVPNSTSLNIQNSISLCAWIKTIDPDIYTDGNGAFIVSKAYTNNSRSYSMVANDGSLGDSIIFQLFNTGNTQFRTTKNSTYYNDKWHFLVSTYDYITGISKIYVDSVLVTTKNIGNVDLRQTTVPLSIGCFWDNSTGTLQRGFYSGIIDDVRIYNRAINQEEVIELFLESITEVEVDKTDEIVLFPNPNNGNFEISFAEMLPENPIVEIQDISGKQLQYNLNYFFNYDKVTIEATGLASGIYFVVIKTKDVQVVRKIIIDSN